MNAGQQEAFSANSPGLQSRPTLMRGASFENT